MGFGNGHAVLLMAIFGDARINDFSDPVDLAQRSRFRKSVPGIETQVLTECVLPVRTQVGLIAEKGDFSHEISR